MEQKIKFPRSQKVYLPGKLYPNIRVAMRKVEQVPSVSFEGEEKIATPNPEIYVYDTSGPLFLQFGGYVDASLAMLPCSIMMTTGHLRTNRYRFCPAGNR